VARAALWGEGAQLDKASALIACCARRVFCALSTWHVEQHASPDVDRQPVPGRDGVAVTYRSARAADPVNDAALIALASDHWWVEAYLPGSSWTNLDPTYPQATVGQAFATPLNDGTDRAADVPSVSYAACA
jgi:transglutaminase-like putative cysteine protease